MKTKPILAILLLLCGLALAGCGEQAGDEADLAFSLRTGIVEGRMAYIGVGGAIDGQINPDLTVQTGQRVRIAIVNGDGASHDLALPDLGRQTPPVMGKETAAALTFTASETGVYSYLCTVAGHRQAGMEGRLVVTQ
ncbi:MAG: hypothetical protein HUU23_17200 [Caldilineales bacterium]|nr:hypothetical protein [Caldilineales bacterium]